MNETKLVEIYHAENSIDAHLFRDALEAEGIRAQITEESVAGMRPNLWWASPRLLVAESDAQKALAIVRSLEESQARRRTP